MNELLKTCDNYVYRIRKHIAKMTGYKLENYLGHNFYYEKYNPEKNLKRIRISAYDTAIRSQLK